MKLPKFLIDWAIDTLICIKDIKQIENSKTLHKGD